MSSDISLTAAQRSSLLSLQRTQKLSERTQTRLSTGKKINTVTDDAVNYFKAKALSDRASDFALRKDGIDQGISALNSALDAIGTIDSFLKQMKGIAEAARSQSTAERQAANEQFKELGRQIYQLVEDASYQGLNLLNTTNSQLDIPFGIRTASRLVVGGLDLNRTAVNAAALDYVVFSVNAFSTNASGISLSNLGMSAGSFTSLGASNSNASYAGLLIGRLDAGIARLRGHAAKLGTNVAILQTRLDFTESYVNQLSNGSDKLTLADLNEEGANLVALQTRQQLGIQSLSISGQQQQAILRLLQ